MSRLSTKQRRAGARRRAGYAAEGNGGFRNFIEWFNAAYTATRGGTVDHRLRAVPLAEQRRAAAALRGGE